VTDEQPGLRWMLEVEQAEVERDLAATLSYTAPHTSRAVSTMSRSFATCSS
jgi:hypothetical protein